MTTARTLWVLALLGLAACGLPAPTNAPIANPYGVGMVSPPRLAASPSASARPSRPAKPKPVAKPSGRPTPAASVTPLPSASPVVSLLMRAQATFAALKSYTADVQSYGKSQGKDIGAKAALTWQAPNRLRMEILDTNITNGDRTVVVDTGGAQVRVKAPGWWPLPVSLDRTDSKLQLPGGPRFDEATLGGVLADASASDADTTAQGDIAFQGRTVTVYHVRGPAVTARGLDHERLGIDPLTRLPAFCEHVGDLGIVTQLVFSNVVADAAVAEDRFTL